MQWHEFTGDDDSVLIVIGDIDDDPIRVLTDLAVQRGLHAAQFTAIGAFSSAVVGWFDRDVKDYRRIPVDQQCEVLSLTGDIAQADDGPQVHAHAVLGLSDGSVRGGHLLEARVWPTLEIVLRPVSGALRKTSRPDLGLALIDLDRTGPATA